MSVLCATLHFITNSRDSGNPSGRKQLPNWVLPNVAKKVKFAGRSRDCSEKDIFETTLFNQTKLRIFYCTRTHSQAAQVFKEFEKTPFAAKTCAIVVGARKQLCLNTLVNTRPINFIDLACHNLLSTSDDKCSFYNTQKKEELSKFIGDNLSSFDIESLRQNGMQKNICPYFTMKKLLPRSNVNIYNQLLACHITLSVYN